jgi:hypothetical protein
MKVRDGEAAIPVVPAVHPVTPPNHGKRRDLRIEVGREIPDLHSLAEDLLPELFVPLGPFLHSGGHGIHSERLDPRHHWVRLFIKQMLD